MQKNQLGAPLLKREIGFATSAFLAFNGVVGAGIFALPGTLAAEFGAFSPWLFPLFGGLIMLIALPMAQLAARTGVTGGPVAYTAVFGPFVAFEVGWLFYIARITALAANSNVFVTYASAFWPPLADGVPRTAILIAMIGLLTWVNYIGIQRAVRALDTLTVMKSIPLVGVAIAGLIMAGSTLTIPSELPQLSEIEVAALLVLYAFVGFENCLVPAEETADARRTIPRAMLMTALATVFLYFIVQLAYVAVMAGKSPEDAPLVAMAVELGGPAAGVVLMLTALVSIAGNLTGTMMVMPRVTYALAHQGSLPAWFGRVNVRYATPANSVLFMGIVGAALAVTGSFVYLAIVSTMARLIVYAASLASLPRLRKSKGEAGYSGPASTISLVGGLAVCGWALLQSDWAAVKLLVALIATGSALYVVARRAASRVAK